MPDHFDPYYTWLGIPREEQPPDHYRLLGVRKFESNSEVISNALDQRMAHIRSFQSEARASQTQQVLNELSQAGGCLLNSGKKTAYDKELREKDAPKLSKSSGSLLQAKPLSAAKPLGQSAAMPVPVKTAAAPVAAASEEDDGAIQLAAPAGISPALKSLVLAGVSCGAVLLIGGLALWAVFGRGGTPQVSPGDDPVAIGQKKPDPKPDDSTGKPYAPDSESVSPEKTPKIETPAVVNPPEKPAKTPGTSKSPEATTIPQPAESGSLLQLGAGGFLEVKNSKGLADAAKTFTVETWVRLDPKATSHFIAGDRVDGPRHPDVPDNSAAGWRFRLIPEGTPLTYTAALAGVGNESTLKIKVADAPFHHVAICAAEGKLTAFVDGKYAVDHEDDWSTSPLNLYLGGHEFLDAKTQGLGGDFVAARVSSNCRYEKNFSPPPVFDTDEDTLVSLDASLNADGNVLPDRSNHRRYGEYKGGTLLVAKSPNRPTESGISPKAGSNYNLKVGNPVDLVDLFRRNPKHVAGKIVVDQAGLRMSGNSPDLGIVNTAIPEQYLIDAEVERMRDGDGITFGLVWQGRQFSALLDGRGQGRPRSCLELADGQGLADNNHPCARNTSVLVNRKPAKLRFLVLKEQVLVLCDDKVMLRWTGAANRLSLDPRYGVTDREALFFGGWNSDFQIHSMVMMPILAATPAGDVVAKAPDPETPGSKPEHPFGSRPGEETSQPREPLPAFGEPKPKSTVKKVAAPDSEVQGKARAEVRSIFKQELAKAVKPLEKVALADKLYKLAKDEKEQPATRYVLFEEARTLKLEAGDVAGAFQIVDMIASTFETDAWKLKSSALKRGAEVADTNDERRRLAEMAIKVAEAAFAAGNLDTAGEASSVATSAANRVGETKLKTAARNLQTTVEAGKKQYDLAQLALERLKTEPDNPKANLAWGRYVSFVKRDWAVGLPYLAKGDSEPLKTAAIADLALPKESEKQASLGDSWYEAAKASSGREKESLMLRAREWYQKSLADAGGLTKLRVTKVLDEITAALPKDAIASASGAGTGSSGMIGRVGLEGRDTGLLVKYEAGGTLTRTKVMDVIGPGVGKSAFFGTMQVELAGVLHLNKPTEIVAKQSGGVFSGGTCALFINGKKVGEVGEANGLDGFYRLSLPAGDHLVNWVLRGRDIGSCQLNFTDADTSDPLDLVYTKQMGQAASALPVRGELSIFK